MATNDCPEDNASFLWRITFWWMNRLIYKGYQKSLEETDLWKPSPRHLTSSTFPLLEAAWKNELAKCHRNHLDRNSRALDGEVAAANEQTTEESSSSSADGVDVDYSGTTTSGHQRHPSLIRCLLRVYGLSLLRAHLCKLVCDVLLFVGPVLQRALIAFTEDDSEASWKGYLYASLFFVVSIVNSCFYHQLFHIGMTTGMKIKAAVIAMVYRKALTMNNEARMTTTVGEIVNLMSVDAQRLQDAAGYLWMIWSAPLQICIAVYMLWDLLGVSVLAGLAVMILLIPIHAVIATASKKLQVRQMKLKDQRIKLINEVLNGIKVLKLYAWELSFQDKVNAVRLKELDTIKRLAYLNAANAFFWTTAPVLVTVATFVTYILTGGVLDAGKAFTAMSLLNILRFPMNMLPMLITYLVTASVSIKRLGAFLQNTDLDPRNILLYTEDEETDDDAISINNGTFLWESTDADVEILKNINLQVPRSSLLAVVGQVGVGKSSIVSAILGEMEKLHGRVTVRGSVAYVAQEAWIQNATLRDNILFGKPFDEERYNRILDACALRPDLQILPAGDVTEIGEKGINLSGGQKQRISMARAVYQDCDIYLLDDPLSAVDSHVGKHVFERVISSDNGLLCDKTRLLVTHGIQWLPMVDNIVVVVDGEISEIGSYEELLSYDRAFAQFLRTYVLQEDSDDDDDDELQRIMSVQCLYQPENKYDSGTNNTLQRTRSDATHNGTSQKLHRTGSEHFTSCIRRRWSSVASLVKGQRSGAEEDKNIDNDKIIQEEISATGKVSFSVYWLYVKSLGVALSCGMLMIFLLSQAASIYSNVWLSEWTSDPLLMNSTLSDTPQFANRQNLFLGVYGALSGAQALCVVIYALMFALMTVHSSRILHSRMLANILRAPMMFFDTTPIGRILNRFSRDVDTVDVVLPFTIHAWLTTFFNVLATLVVISYSTPVFLSVVVPLLVVYYLIQRFYIPTSRQLKRLESTTRSPIYVHFSETITGSSTIRAFQQQQRFTEHSEQLVDHNLVFYFATIASDRWLEFHLELLGAFIIFSAAIFAVLARGSISAGIVGLSITYALQVTELLNFMVRMSSDMETNIVSVERINEYSETPTEADWHEAEISADDDWPSQGHVTFNDYATRYRPGLDLVLSGVSIDIRGGEKVGIVGRTGAGKSSITLSLFRIIEAVHGKIVVDDVDISKMALYPLRSKIVILPQDPVMFSGTLRMNLDPFDVHSDEQIWRALEHAHLNEFVRSLPAALQYECGEGGQNLSVGQRQLICLARTLLRKTKILVLDEATAAVDMTTDELIQKTIRHEFAGCTVLTIAHRMNTIMDSDRVLVLERGHVREFDSPATLLSNRNSRFYSLAKNAGLV